MASDPDLWTYLLLEHLPTESECVQEKHVITLKYLKVKLTDQVKIYAKFRKLKETNDSI